MLFAQITRYKTKNKENIFNLTVQDLEKYSSAAEQLALRGGHRVNRREELVMEAGAEVGDGRARRVVSNRDGGQAAIPLAADFDGTSSGSTPDSIPAILLKK